MEHIRLLIYLITFACGIALISVVIHLYPRYPKEYLKKYLIHILVLNALAVISMFYRYLNIFASRESSPADPYLPLYAIIYVPAIIGTLFALLTYLSTVLSLSGLNADIAFKIFTWASAGVSTVMVTAGLIETMARHVSLILRRYLIISNIIVNISITAASFLLLVLSKRIKEKDRRIFLRGFLALYAACYFLLVWAFVLKNSIHPFNYFASGVIFLLLNLIPLIFIRSALNKMEIRENEIFKTEGMDGIVARYAITARESQIIQLVCSGKSNREIENLLCISVKTVKYHLYNIYKKLGIKNRLELMNMFMRENTRVLRK